MPQDLGELLDYARRRALDALPGSLLPWLAGLVLAFVVALVTAQLATAGRPVTVQLPLPEADTRPTWGTELETFAQRLHSVFGVHPATAREFSGWILEASARQELPPTLVASLIYTESSFRKRARSWAGAIGPAQVKPGIWGGFCGGADLSDPETNVHCGARVLAHYLDLCGDFACAVRLYNVGPGNIRHPHYRRAGDRYHAKIDRHRSRLESGLL